MKRAPAERFAERLGRVIRAVRRESGEEWGVKRERLRARATVSSLED